MKKALSLVLAIMMVFALSTTTFAANLVGTHGAGKGTNGIDDGVETFDDTTSTPAANIDITAVTGAVGHRYAVDIEYVTMQVQITGSDLVWDVNNLEYVSKGSPAGIGGTDKSFAVTITNYSDLPVYLTANVSDKDTNDCVAVKAVEKDTTNLLGAKTKIESALVNNFTKVDYVFDVLVTTESGKTWTDVSNYYIPKFNTDASAKVIATVTVTISKDAP